MDSIKDMTTKFGKLEKFEGVDFRRWQKKMHFLLTALKVVYVLSTPMPKIVGDETLAEIQRKRNKWENDDYICRGHILNGMSDSLFDIYQNVEFARELWDQLESKYMDEDASSKKFLVGNFMNYKMVDSRSEELALVQLGSHLRIEESLRVQDSGKGKGKDVMESSSINMMEKGEGFKNKFKGKKRPFNNINDESNKTPKGACWICGKTGHLKANCKVGKHKKKKCASTSQGGQGSNDQGPPLIKDDVVAWWIDSVATNHVCKDRHWFKDYELVKDGSVLFMGNESTSPIAYRFYVIEPNDSVSVHTVIESRDAIFDESRLSSKPKPRDLVPSSSGAIEGSDNVTTQEATPEIHRSKRKRIAKSFGPDFHTYLFEGSRDECENYYPYCCYIDEDPKTFDEAMWSHDSSFWNEAVNDGMDSIMGNNT
ncbi:uncharacterized protein LOC141613459 [Silene latifolia]|uniref:uncharacterized protein LOC141613459 n=1 Tax=Silene latifolia TaxID=37657 RepID=UPI003D782995